MQTHSESKYRYLFGNIIAFLCGNMGTRMIGFLMVPLYTHMLLPAEYGEMDLLLSVAGVMSPLLACGIHEGIMRFALDKGADHSLVLSIGLRVFAIAAIAFLPVFALLGVIPILGGHGWFLYGYCVLNELMTIMLCYIRGCDNTRLYAFLGFLSALFTALLNIIFLAVLRMGLGGYKTSMLLSPVCTVAAAFLMGRVKKDIHLAKWHTGLAREMLRYSMVLIPNALLWWCINASDRFFVSYLCGTAANGIYAVSYKLPTLLSTVATICMQAWQMSAIREHEEKADHRFSQEIYVLLTFFMGLVTQLMLLVNKGLLRIYVSEAYQSAWLYSGPLMIAFFAGSLGTFWGSFYIAQKRMKKYLLSAVAGAMVNVLLNFCLIPWIGVMGAAAATLASYVVVWWVRAAGIQKDVGVALVSRPLISAFACSAAGMLSAYMTEPWSVALGVAAMAVYVAVNGQYMLSLIHRGKAFLRAWRKRL